MTREEAIRRIKARFDRWALDDEDMKAIQTLIPGLKESEDERIRKALCKFISDTVGYDFSGYGISKEDALAYLEKQKEQDEIPLMNGDADLYFDTWIQYNDTTMRKCFEEGIRYATRLLQREQKPAERSKKDDEQEPEYYQHFDPDC